MTTTTASGSYFIYNAWEGENDGMGWVRTASMADAMRWSAKCKLASDNVLSVVQFVAASEDDSIIHQGETLPEDGATDWEPEEEDEDQARRRRYSHRWG